MKVDARRKEARSTGKVPFFTSYVKLKLKLKLRLVVARFLCMRHY